jgi:hypothetical protein
VNAITEIVSLYVPVNPKFLKDSEETFLTANLYLKLCDV